MKYTDIDRVNGEIKMLDLKGKDYAMVPERVTAFRKLFPEGFIKTEILRLSDDGTVVIMKAEAGYYREDGAAVVLGSGMAKEVQGKGMVNGTSHIENCETSAVGRALGMIGLGINGGGICSAEELANAITAQGQMKAEKKAEPLPVIKQEVTATVDTAAAVPAPKKQTEAQKLIATAKKNLEKEYPGFDFKAIRQSLIAECLIDGKPSDQMTLDEAAIMVDLMYQRARA